MNRFEILDLFDTLSDSLGHYELHGKQIKFDCPKCDQGNKKNLECNYEKKVFKCWSCNFRGGLKKLFEQFAPSSIERYREYFVYDTSTSPLDNEEFAKRFTNFPKKMLPFFKYKDVKKYLTITRGIPVADLVKRKVKYVYSEEENYYNNIFYPFYDNGTMIGACIYNLSTKKYRNLTSLDFVPYKDFIDTNYPITLTEGVIDCLSAINSIPMLGTTINKETLEFLRDKRVIVAIDKSVKIIHKLEIYEALAKYDVTRVEEFDLGEYEDMNEYFLNDKENYFKEYRRIFKKLEENDTYN